MQNSPGGRLRVERHSDLVEALVTPGVQPTQFGCQTAAWSQGLLSQKANLYQRATHHHPCPSRPVHPCDWP